MYNIYHHNADNIGDRMCGPIDYFNFEGARKRSFSDPMPSQGNVLVGGGQIFSQLRAISDEQPAAPSRSLVAWGVGIPTLGKRDKAVLSTARKFTLFGTRNYEWRDKLDFVPCVSCMSALFDDAPEPTHEVVVYGHRKKTPNLYVPDDVPFLTNCGQPPELAINFLASGNTIVTSSYHGVYWAQLLGRKVICVPFGEKFDTFEILPRYAGETEWPSLLKEVKKSESMLEQYRNINTTFYQKVMEAWSI